MVLKRNFHAGLQGVRNVCPWFSYLWPIRVEHLFIFLEKPVHTYMLYIRSPHLSRFSKLLRCTFNFIIHHVETLHHTDRVILHIKATEYFMKSWNLVSVLFSFSLSTHLIHNIWHFFSTGLLQGHSGVLFWREEPVQKLLEEVRRAPRILQVR